MSDVSLTMPRRRAEVQVIGDTLAINLLKHLSEVIGKAVPLTGTAMETFRKSVVASIENLGDFNDSTAKAIFSGKGKIANTIRDHLDAQRFIYGDLSEAEEKAVERLKVFDMGYSTDPEEIAKVTDALNEARAICEDRIGFAAIDRTEGFNSDDDTNLEGGLYDIGEKYPRVLHMFIKPSDALSFQLTIVGREQTDFQIRHCYENWTGTWDGTWTIKDLGELIQEKIDEIKASNKRSPEPVRDWKADFEDLNKEAMKVLGNSDSLPASISRYSVNNETRMIQVIEAPYAMLFCKTSGDYPSEFALVREHYTKTSVPVTDIPEPYRSKLFNAAQVEISYLNSIINKPTESTIDV